ncbi:MAG TPA: hypothetical protein VFK74_02265 [Azospira sp.]|nr:hypothetical protein [Azospira sp.]
MLRIMDMSSGRPEHDFTEPYGEEVLNASWTCLPRVEPRLQLVSTQVRQATVDPGPYLAAFYAAQE